MRISWFIPAILWLLTSTILLVLPGDDLPSSGIFGIQNFDKLVHLGMFALLTFLFAYPFLKIGVEIKSLKKTTLVITLLVVTYGILMEFVQKYWTSDRMFDYVDILFDSLGSFIGGNVLLFFYKKIGPDRNQGRNQN